MAEQDKTEEAKEVKVTVDYKPGRWGQVFHVYDKTGGEVKLDRSDAVKVARQIINIIMGGKEK